MENRSFYNEILTEHNVRPEFKHDLPDAHIVLEGVHPISFFRFHSDNPAQSFYYDTADG